MGLTAELEALLPTEEDVLFYEEHGYYVSKKVLPDELIDQVFDLDALTRPSRLRRRPPAAKP